MGVNCHIFLPDNVRVGNVAKVLGLLCGLPKKLEDIGYGAKSVRVVGADIQGTEPGLAWISIINPKGLVDGEVSHRVLYSFEAGQGRGRSLIPPSTAFWIAIARRLVDFFGGDVVFSDAGGDIKCGYTKPPKSWQENSPEDGSEWDRFQQRVMDIIPITEEEWRECDPLAAYKIGG